MTGALAMQDEQAVLLSATELARHLQRGDLDVELVAVTGSTSADLAARARAGVPARPVLRAADYQSAGRGRLGRSWQGSASGSLLFSLALDWHGAPDASAAVTLACAVALARSLGERGIAATLKWPNDVMLDGRKLAGTLAELVEDASGARTLIIGIGVNIALDPAQRKAIGHPVAELAQCLGRQAATAQREFWLARLALAALEAARQFEARGLAPSVEAFNELFAWRGQPVALHCAGHAPRAGIARGIDAQGRLLFDEQGCLSAVASGEVSLRRHDGQAPGRETVP